MDRYLQETGLLDFRHPDITALIAARGWKGSTDQSTALTLRQITERILSAYDFVRNDVLFGYNEDDAIPASRVLSDGYGQCNTKGILFMALLRALGVPCRIHGFAVDKRMQKGAVTGITYLFAPKAILHSWVEIFCDGRWFNLEGFILDSGYLASLQRKFPDCTGSFCGYGVSVDDFQNPPVEWKGDDTYIQHRAITADYGVFDSPDDLFAVHRQLLSPLKRWMFAHYGRQSMNRNVRRIRDSLIR